MFGFNKETPKQEGQKQGATGEPSDSGLYTSSDPGRSESEAGEGTDDKEREKLNKETKSETMAKTITGSLI